MRVRSIFSAVLFCLCVCFCTFCFTNCRKEKFITDTSASIRFSNDSVLFDTVFSTIGSTTQYLKVYNPHNETIVISDIRLEKGSGSNYRFNVDGVDGPVVNQMEILPNDSIWVFVEVTIDPGAVDVPFVVEDYLVFTTNGNIQKVLLNAWGRDAYFHGSLNYITDTSCPLEIWANDKPHVVYGIVRVPISCTLKINPGCQVYVHGKSGIWVEEGTILAGEENDVEVVFQGDRLEASYQDIPGQWGIQVDIPIITSVGPEVFSIVKGGIWITGGSGSEILNCTLRNGNIGIQVDTSNVSYSGSNYACVVKNTKILNMAGIGLFGQGGNIKGENIVVGNCGQTCAYFSLGGRYHMDNCTFANYWDGGTRTSPAFALNNYYESVSQTVVIRQLYDCYFRNCIMYGNNALLSDFSECVIDIFPAQSELQEYKFEYCLVDTDVDLNNDHFSNMSNGQAPFLCDPANENYKISSSSILMSGGWFSTTPNLDITGANFRTPNNVQKGCYQFTETCD